MITKEAVINNQVGLHARPATFFIQKANEFIVKGTAVTLVADGADEEEAIDTLVALINSDFSE